MKNNWIKLTEETKPSADIEVMAKNAKGEKLYGEITGSYDLGFGCEGANGAIDEVTHYCLPQY